MKPRATAAFVLSLLAILALTLYPEGSGPGRPSFDFHLFGEFALTDTIANVALFVPLGFSLGLLERSPLASVGFAAILSTSAELAQLWVIPGRDPSLRDILTNALGGYLGWTLGTHWRSWVFPSARIARRLAICASAAVVVSLAATSLLLKPSPTVDDYWGQWTPDIGFRTFEGTLDSVRFAGEPLPSGRLPDSRERRSLALATGGSLSASVRVERLEPGPAPIAAVADRHERFIAMIMESGTDLVYRLRLRASDVGLREPQVRFAHAFEKVPSAGDGDTRVWGSLTDGRFRLGIARGRDSVEQTIPLSPAFGWTLVAPMTVRILPLATIASALWFAALCFPLGYYVVRGWPRATSCALLAAAVLTAIVLVLTSRGFGYPFPDLATWLGGGGGIAVGALASRSSERHETA